MVANKADFKKYTAKLIYEITQANMYWELWCDITLAKKEYLSSMNISKHFWTLSLNGYFEATRLKLCRIYDHNSKSLNIHFWLLKIKEDFLKDEFSKWDEKINKDIEIVNDHLVKSLIKHRNHHIAHTSKSSIEIGESWFEKTPLSKEDISTLIRRVIEILNKYNSLIFNEGFIASSPERSDYYNILNGIRSSKIIN